MLDISWMRYSPNATCILAQLHFLEIKLEQLQCSASYLRLWKKSVKIQYIFQNFFAWLTGTTELIFGCKKIFGSNHFLIFFQISWIEKMAGAKKVVNIKNQFFHARQPREGIFDIHSHWCCIFTLFCHSFKLLALLQFWELLSQTWYRDS